MIEDYINLIAAWAKTRGYSVFGKWDEDAFYDKDKEIVYSLRTKEKRHQMYSLLHECGHAIAFDSKGYKDNFPNLAAIRFKTSRISRRRNVVKCETIAEEWDAWQRGFKLARRLGIEVDKKDYFDYASRNVMTYVRRMK